MRQLISFFKRQIRELYKGGGFSILFRKAKTFLLLMVPAALTIPIVILVRALRPFVLIRFGQLASTRIGHYAVDTEMYLCERDAGIHGVGRVTDIFFNASFFPFNRPYICNRQLAKMWNRVIPVFPVARFCYIANRWIPGGRKHVTPWRRHQTIDIYGLLARTKPHLFFTSEEESTGAKMLLELGIPEGASFVCFHSRDSAYLDAMAPRYNWRKHSYRDASIHTYMPALGELARRGYYLIRMGAVVKEPLGTANPKIIDYAVNNRSDFLDIFLSAKCQFFLGSGAGIDGIPRIFRRAIACANLTPFEYAAMWSPNDLCIPKKLWLRKENRFLTFKEVLNSGAGDFKKTEQYEKFEIELVDSAPEEILALVVEMDERLKGIWQTTKEDERLQQRFWSLFKPDKLTGGLPSRVGAEFLRQNRELLEK